MNSVFLLGPEPRRHFLLHAACALRCAYICLWSYRPYPSNCLVSMDGWYHEDDSGQPSPSSSGLLPRRLFDAYRTSFYSVESRRVPGLAYKEGLPYVELGDSDLMNLAAVHAQRRFYQEAGIKTAVFMGCKNGEIEVGMSTLSNINMQMSIQQLFANYLQRSPFGEFIPPDRSWPSSLRSFSAGRRESSSSHLIKAINSFVPDSLMEATSEQASRPMAALVPPHQMIATQAYNPYRNFPFPIPASSDEMMTRAMLAVISPTASSYPSSPPLLYPPPQRSQDYESRMSRWMGAFKPYNPDLAPNFESNPTYISQKMIKLALSFSRRADLMRIGAGEQEAGPTSNQLHHMISERKRREKLNQSFHALRMLLPSTSKKDKASVLANTRDYVKTLRAQISELKARNRMLEMQLPRTHEFKDAGVSSERIEVHIISGPQSTSEVQELSLNIVVRVECDMIDLVLRFLRCLEEMKVVLKSVHASAYPPQGDIFALATMEIQVKASNWDEGTFKEALGRAIDDVAHDD